MKRMYLQSVERYTKESGETGHKATYSNGLDFSYIHYPIKNGKDNIDIPTIHP